MLTVNRKISSVTFHSKLKVPYVTGLELSISKVEPAFSHSGRAASTSIRMDTHLRIEKRALASKALIRPAPLRHEQRHEAVINVKIIFLETPFFLPMSPITCYSAYSKVGTKWRLCRFKTDAMSFDT